jgi:hypothetical protein
MKTTRLRLVVALTTVFAANNALATCDLCSVYVAQQQRSFGENEITLGASEQFSYFGKMQKDGETISDPLNQYLKSSITQVFGRYDFCRDFAIQTNLPIISRSYRKLGEDNNAEKGDISGIGDISVLALYSPLHLEEPGKFFRLTLQGGLKLPTGDAKRLGDSHSHGHDSSEEESHGAGEHADEHAGEHEGGHDEHEDHSMGNDMRSQLVSSIHNGVVHEAIPDGIHPHSLALGSGSWDVVTGVNFFGQVDRWITAGNLQYILRTKGSFDYEYADDLLWDFGVGRYVHLGDEESVAVRVNLSGETKGFDQQNGVEDRSSALTTLFAGPEINVTSGNNVFGLVALDLPLLVDNSGTALAMDYRVRFAVMYRF